MYICKHCYANNIQNIVVTVFGGLVAYIRNVLDGNMQVPIVNWNGDNRNLNANNWDDDWNDKYRFLFVRKSLSFSRKLITGVFFFLL